MPLASPQAATRYQWVETEFGLGCSNNHDPKLFDVIARYPAADAFFSSAETSRVRTHQLFFVAKLHLATSTPGTTSGPLPAGLMEASRSYRNSILCQISALAPRPRIRPGRAISRLGRRPPSLFRCAIP